MTSNIIGYEKVIEAFGYWPTFHDDEIVQVLIDNTCVIISVQSKTKPDNLSYFPKLEFVFAGDTRYDFEGEYIHQNVIFNIEFETLEGYIKAIIHSSIGFNGEITAETVAVSVLEIIPYDSLDLCCWRFTESVKEDIIHRARGYDETEWIIAGGDHIYYCPYCGSYIKGEGFGKPPEKYEKV